MTLNDLERRNSPYVAFFSPNSIDFQADYVTVIEDRPIMSANIVSQFQSSTFGRNWPTLQRGLFAILVFLFNPYYSNKLTRKVANSNLNQINLYNSDNTAKLWQLLSLQLTTSVTKFGEIEHTLCRLTKYCREGNLPAYLYSNPSTQTSPVFSRYVRVTRCSLYFTYVTTAGIGSS